MGAVLLIAAVVIITGLCALLAHMIVEARRDVVMARWQRLRRQIMLMRIRHERKFKRGMARRAWLIEKTLRAHMIETKQEAVLAN